MIDEQTRKREETRISALIRLDIGAEPDFQLLRNNNGMATYGKAKVAYGLGTSSPDFVGQLFVMPDVSAWVCFEVKVPGEDATDEQKDCHKLWRSFGAIVFVVHSAEEARAALEYARGTVRARLNEYAARLLASATTEDASLGAGWMA